MYNNIVKSDDYFGKISQLKNIVCFGAGSKGLQSLHLLKEMGVEPIYFVDNDSKKWGKVREYKNN